MGKLYYESREGGRLHKTGRRKFIGDAAHKREDTHGMQRDDGVPIMCSMCDQEAFRCPRPAVLMSLADVVRGMANRGRLGVIGGDLPEEQRCQTACAEVAMWLVARLAMTSALTGTSLGAHDGLGSKSRFRPGAPVPRERLGARDNLNLRERLRLMKCISWHRGI